jgi:hypothetical protein
MMVHHHYNNYCNNNIVEISNEELYSIVIMLIGVNLGLCMAADRTVINTEDISNQSAILLNQLVTNASPY